MTDSMSGKLILFDIANTLVTFRSDLRTERFEKLCGLSAEQLNARLFNDSDSPGMQFDRGLIVSSEFYDRCCAILEVEPTEEFAALFRHAYQDIFEGRPEMGALVEELAAEHDLWLMSNTNVWHLDYVRAQYDYFKFFDTNSNSCDTRFVKPEPEIFVAAIERSGRSSDELIFVDDRQANVDAAKTLGIRGILFESVDALRVSLNELLVGSTV
jgi:HAD superfamily hydrolase (TIGR01509 family)